MVVDVDAVVVLDKGVDVLASNWRIHTAWSNRPSENISGMQSDTGGNMNVCGSLWVTAWALEHCRYFGLHFIHYDSGSTGQEEIHALVDADADQHIHVLNVPHRNTSLDTVGNQVRIPGEAPQATFNLLCRGQCARETPTDDVLPIQRGLEFKGESLELANAAP
jgi:hypothetical protein